MEISMMEIGLTIKLMDMGFSKMLMGLNMRGTGWMINNMVMAMRLGKMEKLGILETFIMAKNMEEESLSGTMDHITMGSSRMVILRDMVSCCLNLLGTYVFADIGKVYVGEFRGSNMEGRGTENWEDGRKYEGDYK
jgi:hypothetical protein